MLCVRTAITSTTEKYHSSRSASHAVRTSFLQFDKFCKIIYIFEGLFEHGAPLGFSIYGFFSLMRPAGVLGAGFELVLCVIKTVAVYRLTLA